MKFVVVKETEKNLIIQWEVFSVKLNQLWAQICCACNPKNIFGTNCIKFLSIWFPPSTRRKRSRENEDKGENICATKLNYGWTRSGSKGRKNKGGIEVRGLFINSWFSFSLWTIALWPWRIFLIKQCVKQDANYSIHGAVIPLCYHFRHNVCYVYAALDVVDEK